MNSIAIQATSEELRIELPDRPEADLAAPDETDWLFDSSRDYLDQLAAYKAQREPSEAAPPEPPPAPPKRRGKKK
jgi:hypothetical protein